MGYTSFGEFVRVLRVKRHEVMGDLAKALGVSVSFLSSVETGKKNVPEGWAGKIAEHFGLSNAERRSLDEAIEESKVQYKIVAQNAGFNQRKAAMQFARSFDDMDDETAMKILELLNRKERDKKNGL